MGAASSQPPPEPQGAGLPRLDEAEGAGSARLRALSLARCSRLLQNFDPDMGSSASFNEILCLLDLEGCEYVDANELQHATQRLIDVLGCRHPSTLRRVSEVYVSVASGREGTKGQQACGCCPVLVNTTRVRYVLKAASETLRNSTLNHQIRPVLHNFMP